MCVYCLYGIDKDGECNRIQRLEQTHPQLHNYCLNKLGLKEVMEYMNIPYINQVKPKEVIEEVEEIKESWKGEQISIFELI